jgi:hypothetical protein
MSDPLQISPRRRAVRAWLAGICVVLAAAPLPAAASTRSAYSAVLRAYQTTGTVPACEFTSRQLSSALKGIDTYGAQYFSDFASAVQAALSARAAGSCERGAGAALARLASARPSTSPPPPPLGAVTTPTDANLPLPLLLMIALGGCGLAGVLLAGVWRWRGWSPRWAIVWRHATGEAAYRTEGTWLDFTDWLRSGR